MRGAEEHPGRSTSGNATNPRIGSGMQQARKSSGGVNRRGRAKRRGRNVIVRVAPHDTGDGSDVGVGENGHRRMMSMEGKKVRRTSVTTAAMSAVAGRHRDESQERRSEAPTRALEQEPWRGAKLTRAGQDDVAIQRNDGEEDGRLEGPVG